MQKNLHFPTFIAKNGGSSVVGIVLVAGSSTTSILRNSLSLWNRHSLSPFLSPHFFLSLIPTSHKANLGRLPVSIFYVSETRPFRYGYVVLVCIYTTSVVKELKVSKHTMYISVICCYILPMVSNSTSASFDFEAKKK